MHEIAYRSSGRRIAALAASLLVVGISSAVLAAPAHAKPPGGEPIKSALTWFHSAEFSSNLAPPRWP